MALVKLSTKLVGSTVKLNENSSPVEFVVAQQGSPSSAYVGFDGGTTLVRKGAHSSRIWGEDNGERYYNYPDDCEIHTWLNNTYLNTLDSDIQAAVKQVKIPYVSDVDYGGAGSVNQGSNGLSCKVFLLSLAEVGFSATSGYSGVPDEGTVLSWFASSGDDARNLNGNDWWLRTPAPASSGQYAYYCTDGGSYPWMSQGYNAGNTTQSKYVRPALVLDAELYVDDNGNVITNQPPSAPSSIAASNVIGNQNATVTLGAATDEDGTIANYIYERQVDGGAWQQVAKANSLTQTDQISEDWGTVAYRACAVDDLGVSGPYVTGETQTINSGWVTIGGPAEAMGSKPAPFDFDFSVSVSGVASTGAITVYAALDGEQVYSDTPSAGTQITIPVDTRLLGAGEHAIEVQASKDDYLPASKRYTFTVPAVVLPDGGVGALAQGPDGRAVYHTTLAQRCIGRDGVDIQAQMDALTARVKTLEG